VSRDWRAGAKRLQAAGVGSASRDAQILAREAADFDTAIARRETHEPISHILGKRAFWAHDFIVSAAVLDPRPDTETLVEAALAEQFTRVLDLGTGSGCILISLLAERKDASGLGVDISRDALEIAQTNANNIDVSARAAFKKSDWFSNIEGTFDMIVSNPPYIDAKAYQNLDAGVKEYEPKVALTPGGDGLEPYRILAARACEYLKPDGWLMVEIGFDQGETVPEIFQQKGWINPKVVKDLNGHPRVVKLQG
jgi:release factor glutamine methyltransferase